MGAIPMIQMISATEFETMAGDKTFNLKRQATSGHWIITSWQTANPKARVFWGCETLPSLAEVEAKYKMWRGVLAMLGALLIP